MSVNASSLTAAQLADHAADHANRGPGESASDVRHGEFGDCPATCGCWREDAPTVVDNSRFGA